MQAKGLGLYISTGGTFDKLIDVLPEVYETFLLLLEEVAHSNNRKCDMELLV